MPRSARACLGGICYHVINRGNRRAEVFHNASDYAAFEKLMQRACARLPMRVVGYCLMPNHFHLVLWPHNDGDVSRWMQWLLTCHVRRYHRINRTEGRIWQGRFKDFAIERDDHLFRVLRYVERNPLRANLVAKAEAWPWSSLKAKRWGADGQDLPVCLPQNWLEYVNRPETEAELRALRRSVNREIPL